MVSRWNIGMAEEQKSFMRAVRQKSFDVRWIQSAGRRASETVETIVMACKNEQTRNNKYVIEMWAGADREE